MLKTFKHYAKHACLAFAILLFTVSCENEEVIITETAKNAITVKAVDKSAIVQNKNLLNTLSGFNASLQNNKLKKGKDDSFSNDYDFIINSEIANYVVNNNNNYHSYTFTIEREEETTHIENITFSINEDGTYLAQLITYHTNAQQKKAFIEGQHISLENVKTFYRTIEFDNNNNFSNSCEDNPTDEDCWYIEIIMGSDGFPACYIVTGDNFPIYTPCLEDVEGSSGGNGSGNDNQGGNNLPGGNGFPNGTGSDTGTGNYPGGGTTTTGGNTNTGGNTTTTSPLPPRPIWYNIDKCINGLVIGGDNTTIDTEILEQLNFRQLGQINNYLKENSCSENAQAFAIAAAEALAEGGDVDFIYKRINGIKLDTNLPPCIENMVLDLMLGNFPPTDIGNIDLIEKTFNSLAKSENDNNIGIIVNYKTGDISGNGKTEGKGYNSTTRTVNIDITISNDLVRNGTKLALIKTILHESIHAYLLKIKQEYPIYFNNSNEFSQLALGYQNYNNVNDPQHIYMASIIEIMANNVSNFVKEKYYYPQSDIDYYKAVCWSGLTHLTNGSLNPLFSDNYPNFNDQQNVIKIFNTENGTGSYSGYNPLIDNNCN